MFIRASSLRGEDSAGPSWRDQLEESKAMDPGCNDSGMAVEPATVPGLPLRGGLARGGLASESDAGWSLVAKGVGSAGGWWPRSRNVQAARGLRRILGF